jgi:hypothetical protein
VCLCSVRCAELLFLNFKLNNALRSQTLNTTKTSPEVTMHLTRCSKALSANHHSSRHPINLPSCIKQKAHSHSQEPPHGPHLPYHQPAHNHNLKTSIIMTSSIIVNQETLHEIQNALESNGAAGNKQSHRILCDIHNYVWIIHALTVTAI